MSRSSFLSLQQRNFLCLFLLFVSVYSKECYRFKQCKGPIRYYEDLNCKPVYANPGDCCAVRYDCLHLSNRTLDKCYANGREYEIGESLRDEDRTYACNTDCMCKNSKDGIAVFTCGVAYCSYGELEGCYLDFSSRKCCGKKVCSQSEFHCNVDGKIYKIGQEFYPQENPDLVCHCLEGYNGENIAPYCIKSRCGTEMYDSVNVLSNCVPVFPADLEPQSSCRWFTYRCQNENDTVIHSKIENFGYQIAKEQSDEMMCKFGNMTMRVGDQLNQDTGLSSICVKCVCEVPPTLTCQRFPESQCGSEKYMAAYNFIKKMRPDRNYF